MSRRKSQFTEDNIRSFIEEVKKRPCLWHPDNENYNDRASMASAWEEIKDIMQQEENVLRQKWKTIRDMFKREVRRCHVTDIDDYAGKWRYFKSLWFLHRPEEYPEDCEILVVSPESRNIKFEPKDCSIYDVNDDPDSDPLPDKQIRIESDEDYDLMFLKSLTPYLRELDPIRRLVVRSKIQEMVLNEMAAQKAAKK